MRKHHCSGGHKDAGTYILACLYQRVSVLGPLLATRDRLTPCRDSQHPNSFFPFSKWSEAASTKSVHMAHCYGAARRCIFACYNLSCLLERLIKFIKDTAGLLLYGRARIQTINFRFVPSRKKSGNVRSDAAWQTWIWFWKLVSWISFSFSIVCIY